jgi:hypothetical protein
MAVEHGETPQHGTTPAGQLLDRNTGSSLSWLVGSSVAR